MLQLKVVPVGIATIEIKNIVQAAPAGAGDFFGAFVPRLVGLLLPTVPIVRIQGFKKLSTPFYNADLEALHGRFQIDRTGAV